MTFTRVVDLVDDVEAFQLNQYAAAFEGDADAGKPITLTALNDSAAYALRVANQDTTNGRAFKVFKANLTDSWIDVTKSGNRQDGLQLLQKSVTPDAPDASGYTALYAKTSDGGLYYRAYGGSEVALGLGSLLSATGDLPYASAANTPARRAIGTTGQALTVVGGVPDWAASATSVLSATGDSLYASAANTLARRAIGTTDQVMTVVGGVPNWADGSKKTLTTTGDLLYASGANTLARRGIGSSGQALMVIGGVPQWETVARKNFLLNGSFQVAQRYAYNSGVSVTDNTVITADRWRMLYDTSSNAPSAYNSTSFFGSTAGASRTSLTFQAANSATGRHGMFQVIGSANSSLLRGKSVSLSFTSFAQSGFSDIRAAIVYWTGTADDATVANDPVTTWSSLVSGTPGNASGLSGSWLFANTPANLSITAGGTVCKIENISIPQAATHVGVLVWCDDTTTTFGEFWGVNNIQLEIGSISTAFEPVPYEVDLMQCGSALFIAASNASAAEKASSQFICDGTADEVEINAAITALPSTGGCIELSSGTFTINAAINTNKAGMTLVGQGKNTVIKVVNSASGSFANSAIIYNTAADITFRDFKLNANRSNNTGHSTYSGINLGAGSTGTILVDGVWVDNFAVYGFDISSSVTGGRFVNCRASTGVDSGYGFMVRDSATAVALFNCVSNSNTGGGFHSQGTRVTHVACLAYSNTGSGFEAAYGTATDNRYAACLAYSNSTHGFHTISPAVRPSYVGCTADNNGGHGFNIVSGVTGANVMDCVSHSNGTAANNTYQNFAFNGTDGYINGCMARVGANANKPSYGMAVAGTNNYVGYNDLYGSGNVSDYIEGGTNTRKPARVQASVAGGDTIASTAAETNFATNHVFPAGTLTSVEKLLKVRAWGTYSTLGSGTVTLQLKLKMGSTTLIDFGSITTAISIASRRWDLEAELLVAGVGGSGPIEAAGKARIPTANTDVGFSAPAIGGSITIDTTASQTLQISAQHGASSASNTITMRQFSVVTLN